MTGPRSSPELAPRPRPISRRGWRVLIAVGIVVVALYAMVVAFYNAEGGSADVGGVGGRLPSQSAILAMVEPIAIDAGKDQTTLNLTFSGTGSDLVDDSGRLVKNIRITVTSMIGTQEVKYLAGEPLGRFEATVGLLGEQTYYPFDRHAGAFGINADSYTKAADGSLVSSGDIPVGLAATGSVSGWDVDTNYPTDVQNGATGVIGFDRSFSTRAFVLVMLLLALSISVASLVVAVLIFTNRRRAEVALLGWAAAVLFALPLLRTYFPNAPPVGASLDIYIYLWIIVAAVLAAVLDVIAWLRQSGATLVARFEAEREDHNAT